MLIKIANSEFVLNTERQIPPEKALGSTEITERFKKLASEIKKVAPRSGDFLYFIARGIHAMEHAAIDPVTRQYDPKIGHIAYDDGCGSCKHCKAELLKTSSGPVSGLWCKSSTIDPWINQNGDAFPEIEILMEVNDPQNPGKTIRAYQTFIGKGLFTDHKSSEVENIRGIILDAEYDHNTKGVDLLIALDKISYPELARQITAGYSAQVSMGTAVNYSYCNICGNKAVTENDYCHHVKSGKAMTVAGQQRCYEVNNGLSFIELSMVGNAADPRARIRTIVAAANNIKKNIEANLESNTQESENQLILDSIYRLEHQINDLQVHMDNPSDELESNKVSFTQEIVNKVANLEKQIKEIGGRFMTQKSQEKKAYMQGTVEPEVGKPFKMSDKDYPEYWKQDIEQTGKDQTNGTEGLAAGYELGSDEEVKRMYQRASTAQRKLARQKLIEKLSYFQGTVEPEEKPFQMADKSYTEYWKQDIEQTGKDLTSGAEGLMANDEALKKELLRANKLRAKLEKSANSTKNKWTVFAGSEPVLSVTAEEAYGSDLQENSPDQENVTNEQWFNSRNYGINLIQACKHLGIEKVAEQINKAKVVTAQAMPPMPMAPEAAPAEMPIEEPKEEELGAEQGIKDAAERIESAKDEILSYLDELAPEQAAEGGAIADELGSTGEELGQLGAEMGAPLPLAAAKVHKKILRAALSRAEKLLIVAEKFALKVAAKDEEDEKEEDEKEEEDDNDVKITVEDAKKDDVEVKEASLKARKAARRKIAEEIYNLTDGDMIAEAHPKGGNETTFPGQPEGKIETVTEAQEDDMEVVSKAPTGEVTARMNRRQKILAAARKLAETSEVPQKKQEVADAEKKEADEAQKAATEAKKEVTAEVDKETKQYYAELASETATGQKPDPEVKKYYTELTQDFATKKSTAAVHDHGLKMKRAFAVALKRANLGQIESTTDAINADVDRLMGLDNDSFTSLADVVENTKKVNTATSQKQVRTAGSLNVGIDQTPKGQWELLEQLPWK